MWWIAACLGALVWLLVVRIKLKEKQRNALLEAREAQSQASARAKLVKEAFLPTARHYLAAHPDVDSLALVFAVFEWPNRPSEVHVCVLPVLQPDDSWPSLLNHCKWVEKRGAHWVFDAPESHWVFFKAVGESAHVAAFAPLFESVADSTPFGEAYHLYALARREGGTLPELEVVGEPAF